MKKYIVEVEACEWCGYFDSLELDVPDGVDDIEAYVSENLEVCIMLENLENEIHTGLEASDFCISEEEFEEDQLNGAYYIAEASRCHITAIRQIED